MDHRDPGLEGFKGGAGLGPQPAIAAMSKLSSTGRGACREPIPFHVLPGVIPFPGGAFLEVVEVRGQAEQTVHLGQFRRQPGGVAGGSRVLGCRIDIRVRGVGRRQGLR